MRPILRAIPVLLLLARPAAASDPSSIYTVPSKVEILPDDVTGTSVVIHGAFFFLSAPMSFTYGQPRCGYMSFQCPAGKEAMCRLQWQDLRKSMGSSFCAGFGTLGAVSNAALHPEPFAAVKPDIWDLGMGISQGSYVDGKCGPARSLICALPAPDAGPPAPDAAASPDASAPDSAPPGPDLAVVDAPLAPDAPVLAADAAEVPQPAKPSGCAFGGTGGLVPLLIAFLALARRSRR
jgi:hypothetical protein